MYTMQLLKKIIKVYIMDELANELHKPVIRKFKRRKVKVSYVDEIHGADLVDMKSWEDKKYKYILTVIDVFSKYAWAIPLKTKTADEVTSAFNKIERVPLYLWVDQGSEFYNRKFEKYLDSNNTSIYSTFGEHKSAVIERFNRTLKSNMFKYFTATGNTHFSWADILPKLLNEYNNKVHSTIKMTPKDASKKKNEDKVFENIYSEKHTKQKPAKYKKGDKVRLSKIKKTFEKGYTNNWTREVFIISEVKNTDPVTYNITEYDGSLIEGSFYTEELQKVNTPIIFQLDAVLKTRTKNKKKEHYVHYFGWPNKYNEWIFDSKLQKLL